MILMELLEYQMSPGRFSFDRLENLGPLLKLERDRHLLDW